MVYNYSDYEQGKIEDILAQAQQMANACGVSTEAALAAMQIYEAKKASQYLSDIESKTEEVHDAVQSLEQSLEK